MGQSARYAKEGKFPASPMTFRSLDCNKSRKNVGPVMTNLYHGTFLSLRGKEGEIRSVRHQRLRGLNRREKGAPKVIIRKNAGDFDRLSAFLVRRKPTYCRSPLVGLWGAKNRSQLLLSRLSYITSFNNNKAEKGEKNIQRKGKVFYSYDKKTTEKISRKN